MVVFGLKHPKLAMFHLSEFDLKQTHLRQYLSTNKGNSKMKIDKFSIVCQIFSRSEKICWGGQDRKVVPVDVCYAERCCMLGNCYQNLTAAMTETS